MFSHFQLTKKHCCFEIPRALTLLAQKKEKLFHLAEFYPNDFSSIDLVVLEIQLDVYIMEVGAVNKFSG